MLIICADTVPHTKLTYLAFRLAALETFRLIEFAQQSGQDFRDPYGFLTEVPFLREVAPQVQLSLLAETWAKITSTKREHSTLVDEAVLYAACETAARTLEQVPELFHSFTETGPTQFLSPPDKAAIKQLRAIHLDLANEGDFLLISQFQDLDPTEASNYKRQFRMSERYLEPLFDVLGMWSHAPETEARLSGLFTVEELTELMPIVKNATAGISQLGESRGE